MANKSCDGRTILKGCCVVIFLLGMAFIAINNVLLRANPIIAIYGSQQEKPVNNVTAETKNATNEITVLSSLPITYAGTLASLADANKVIILALVDTGFMDMTLNFHETSLAKFGIQNYLFLATDVHACRILKSKGIHCFLYMNISESNVASVYRSAKFKQKMNVRTFMILEALKLGYTVLHTDVDMIFFKNPLNDLAQYSRCDLAMLWDHGAYNAGFLLVRPTSGSIKVYEHMDHTARTTTADDQTALNKAIGANKSKLKKVVKLPTGVYACGFVYFESRKHFFVGDVKDGAFIVAHNNWIVSKEAKRYRFRETHLWLYDDENGYYSDPRRTYLTYANPNPAGNATNVSEVRSLQTALYFGSVLNRTVIIPKFQKNSRPMNSVLKIQKLDSLFANKYRERTFLKHPKVPTIISESTDVPQFLLKTEISTPIQSDTQNMTVEETTHDQMNRTWILHTFGNLKQPVIHFESFLGLYGTDFMPVNGDEEMRDKLKKAMKKSKYRQI